MPTSNQYKDPIITYINLSFRPIQRSHYYHQCQLPTYIKIPLLMPVLLITALLVATAASLGLPLVDSNPRCMIAYTDDPSETLKLDVYFPMLPNQVNGQVYQITTTNTETNVGVTETVSNGKYLREIELQQNHVYRICFKIWTNRPIGTIVIDYNSEVQYRYDASQIKIPTDLLKNKDTRMAYELAENMEKKLRRKGQENTHFANVIDANDRMTTISYIELGLVISVGAYQFYMIRKFLIGQRYM